MVVLRPAQYICELTYTDSNGSKDSIKFELGLRGDLMTNPVQTKANTLLIDPFSEKPVVPPFPISALSFEEAFAEKIRAALTRREPAIRDFFDLIQLHKMSPSESMPAIIALARRKITHDGVTELLLPMERYRVLQAQMASDLRPVLQPSVYEAFPLEHSWQLAERFVEAISNHE